MRIRNPAFEAYSRLYCTAVGLGICVCIVQQWVLAFVLCPWKEGFAVEIITVAFLAQTGKINFSFYRETDESRDEYQCFVSVIGINADPEFYLDAAQIFFTFHQIFL